MNNSDSQVLLIEFSANRKKLLLQMLLDLGYTVITVQSVEAAIQKALSFSPDLIVCVDDLGEYTGFQMYNMLEQEILKKGIPFILVLGEYSSDEILMGEELGIDAFLFPPFDQETVDNILKSRIHKFHASQSISLRYFKKLYELIPLGIFIAENRKIIEGNKFFFNLIGNGEGLSTPVTLDDLFDFSANPSYKIKLARFLNGITKSSCFNDLKLKNNGDINFRLSLHYLENGIPDLKIVGTIIPYSQDDGLPFNGRLITGADLQQDMQEVSFLTKREQEVLKLSAEGLPIKLIASELKISERTVEKHRSNILHKTNSGNIIEALAFIRKYPHHKVAE